MSELLLELLSEEIPARMQRRAIEDLTGLVRDKLAAAEIPASGVRGYVTPRRLAVIAEGIPATQPDRSEERRGPRVGAPQPAIEGFLRSAGLRGVEECEIRDTGRGEFYFAVVRRSGRPSAEVLPELIRAAIVELPWPKSMRWPGSPLRWVRPLTSIVCLYDGEILPLALDGVPVGRTTRGHRFLAPGEICVDSTADYLGQLQHARVILDQDRRQDMIRSDLDRRAAELGVAVKPDPGLLDEVTGLVRIPGGAGRRDRRRFHGLAARGPANRDARASEILFVCPPRWPAGAAFPVRRQQSRRGRRHGDRRRQRARIARPPRRRPLLLGPGPAVRLEDRVEALKGRVYHAKLGSMYDKAERMEKLAEFLAEKVRFADETFVAPAKAGVQGNRPELIAPGFPLSRE